LLIVVGVTLALMASSWYESRQESRDELNALRQLKVALEADLEILSNSFRVMREAEQDITELLAHFKSGATHTPAINRHLSGVTRWRGARLRSAPYEQIKNQGLSLISNSSIRVRLIDLYENQFSLLRSATDNDRIVSRDQIAPYFFARFRRPDYEEWEPIDYAALRSDPVFENLLIAKSRRLQGFVLPAYEGLIQAIREILAEIDQELGVA
jgi:hypothetical protein